MLMMMMMWSRWMVITFFIYFADLNSNYTKQVREWRVIEHLDGNAIPIANKWNLLIKTRRKVISAKTLKLSTRSKNSSFAFIFGLLCSIVLKFPFACIHRAHINLYLNSILFMYVYAMPHSLCIVKPRGLYFYIHSSRCRHQSKMFLFCFFVSRLQLYASFFAVFVSVLF